MIIPITLAISLLAGVIGVLIARMKKKSAVLWGSIAFVAPIFLMMIIVPLIETHT